MQRKNKFGIYATCSGVIYHVGKEHEIRNGEPYNSKYGNRIYKEIENTGKYELYAHLSDSFVEAGQYVEAGQLIGIMGNTGCNEQSLIDGWTMTRIMKENYALYAWVVDMQCKDDGVIIIYDDMRENKYRMDQLNDYLVKHLHYSIFPDYLHLSGKYAIDPRDHLKSCIPPCNSLQSAKWNEVNYNYWKVAHEGVDFSGLLENIIFNWQHQTGLFLNNFRESIT